MPEIYIMDDIIVIILTIVFLVVGLLGQNKKGRKKQKPDAGEKKEPSVWETLFEELGMQQPEKPQYQAEPEPFLDFEGRTSRLRTENNKEETNLSKPEEGKIDHVKKLQSRKMHPLMKDFSLKKALVYSEIMNPKYLND